MLQPRRLEADFAGRMMKPSYQILLACIFAMFINNSADARQIAQNNNNCLLYTSPSPRDRG